MTRQHPEAPAIAGWLRHPNAVENTAIVLGLIGGIVVAIGEYGDAVREVVLRWVA